MKNLVAGFCAGIALFTLVFCARLQAKNFVFNENALSSWEYVIYTNGVSFDAKGRYSYWWDTRIVVAKINWLL